MFERGAFNTTALPILEYVPQVFSPHTKQLVNDIDRVRRKALRWAYQLKRLEGVTEVLSSKKIRSWQDCHKDSNINVLRKIEFAMYDLQIENYVKQNQIHNTICTSQVIKLQLNININQFKFCYDVKYSFQTCSH